MNRDFAEMLSALSDAGAEFLSVGAHALATHGTPRAAGGLDIWINPTPANAALVMTALRAFGAPLANLTSEDLTTPGLILQIGVVPSRAEIPDHHLGGRIRRCLDTPNGAGNRRR